MKPNEITQDGYYWWRDSSDGAWRISLVDDGAFYFGVGRDECLPQSEATGEFVGPLVPPADAPTQCTCPCHNDEPGDVTLHMMPCCDRPHERFNPADRPG